MEEVEELIELKNSNKVVGLNQSRRALDEGTALVAYVARDADMYVVFPFEQKCKEKGVEIRYADTMKELAKACEVEVPTAVAVIIGS